ncbi:MAG: HDOD domain-containing protein [Burkholderiales bacterium]
MDSSEALKIIVAEAVKGNLNFPTSAKVAFRVRETLDDPDCSIEEAVRLVKAEPLIASRVVAMANSIAYNSSGKEIADVRAAVMRLGFAPVRSAAAAVATRQMTGASTDPASQQRATKLWEHTMHVAALANVIARRVTKQDPEAAMFTGIIHEVAGFYLLSRTGDFPALLDDELHEWLPNDDSEIDGDDIATGGGERDIGRLVLKALSVPAAIVQGMEELWAGYLTLPPVTLGDTLLLADQLAPVRSPLRDASSAMQDKFSAEIDMAIGEKTLVGILEESAEQMESLVAALKI